MSPDERTFCPAPTCGQRQRATRSRSRSRSRAWARHTDGAVFAVPAGAALALAVAARPVLRTARVAGPLVAGRPHPAFLAAAGAPHADSVAATVGSTDLCGEEEGGGRGDGGERKGREGRKTKHVLSRSLLGTRVTLGYPPRLL